MRTRQGALPDHEVSKLVAITAPSDAREPFTATFTFSEDTGFVVGDISLANAAASNFSGVWLHRTSGDLRHALCKPPTERDVAGYRVDQKIHFSSWLVAMS